MWQINAKYTKVLSAGNKENKEKKSAAATLPGVYRSGSGRPVAAVF